LNPQSRSFGSPENQKVFESLIDQFLAEYGNLSRAELKTRKQEADYENSRYYEKRGRVVGTRSSKKIGGGGSITIVSPLRSPSDRSSQRNKITQYEREHLDENMKILAKLDSLELLLRDNP
jgi:hypothetical protein